MMTKLIEYKSKTISRGCVFRFPAIWPYDSYIDLLVVDIPDEGSGYSLVVTTGHKAGLILVRLPNECESVSNRSISYQWILDNWNKWIYPDCNLEDILIIEHYDEPMYTFE
ncbi:hypothetical protein GMW39_20595 [Pectobacterium parmentieri]|uniref:Imm45 family immunity protein n=1 Tax=Pectobacterium parmentieri TaxID=1905730 RepID=UPI000CDDAD4F|nr:Imm45 family immunity protein [Pectobacterium parmentieri]AYH16470.1 hypothetical protein C5E23_21035 [Pectobacterium parmentieri]QHQ17990.1 hypothetical protein GMW39_20595 [Pectobacterium parmentieri]QPK19397.1 hypothetical protein PB20LOC_018615 [Pectobacterium parmentieri]